MPGRWASLLFVVSGAFACAASPPPPTSKSACEGDAHAEYRRCVNPQFWPEGQQKEMPSSQEGQACQSALRQTLGRCSDLDPATSPLPTTWTPTAAESR